MAKKREFSVFSLSFLDIMSCGFGAVILIFIVIQHSTETTSQELSLQLLAEVSKLEIEVEEGQENLVLLKNTIDDKNDEIATTQQRIQVLLDLIRQVQAEIWLLENDATSKDSDIEDLKDQLKKLEDETAKLKGSLEANEAAGRTVQTFSGEGDRQYLTGIKIGGEYVLLLVDASASMLDKTIVNVIRRRNLPPEQQRESAKWQRAIRTVEWITANMPHQGKFQIYTFNTRTGSVLEDTTGTWLAADKGILIKEGVEELKTVVPGGGTSLHGAFESVQALSPLPDNIFLITDSLPTQGRRAPRGNTVDGRTREEFFRDSIEELPAGIPVNVILFPMEGDPLAAPNFWHLAQLSGGSFLSPSNDWP